jgi:DNA-binding MarR family transcriptional regulator
MTTTGSSERELDVARLLTLVERCVVARLAAALKEHGATVEQWRVMSLLGDEAGRTMTEIAEYAMLPAPTLTKIVDRMVSAGHVYRRVDETDRRRVLVFASDRGREAFHRWTATVRSERDSLGDVIGNEEIALLTALLSQASGRLSRTNIRLGQRSGGLSVPPPP